MINKVFTFEKELDAIEVEESIRDVVSKWYSNHPTYTCSIKKQYENGGFQIIVNCYDFTNSPTRLN